MKRYRIGTSEDRLFTQLQDSKTGVTATIPNYEDAWATLFALMPGFFPRENRLILCNLIRLGWYQRVHRLLP